MNVSRDLPVFQSLWAKALRSSNSADRLDAATDRAFWKRYAPLYDKRIGEDGEEVTLDYIRSVVRPIDSLLDVGSGTGRFALPLADNVGRITAVDHSPEMLKILRRKAGSARVTTIVTTQGEWPNVNVEPHYVVLAAWSLYRSIDLSAALSSCVDAARRSVIIVLGVGDAAPHRRYIEELFGNRKRSSIPAHLYVAGALWAMGLSAEIDVLSARRRVVGDTPTEVARALAPTEAHEAEIEKLAEALGSHIHTRDSGCEYLFDYGVGVVTWSRSRDE